jgi:hypothetical protein
METQTEKSSAELQREIDRDRQRIENRIDAIQERMSPGQLIDEIIDYAKTSGGAEYVGNLGAALNSNPLPVALMGVSLAWLMAKGSPTPHAASAPDIEPPLYPVTGSVRRIGPPERSDGLTYSHFADDAGNKVKALTDDAGQRAGHFVDEAGKAYRGFVDASGSRVESIMDETGAILDAASGWASDRWGQAKDAVNDMSGRASRAVGTLSSQSSSAAAILQEQTTRLNARIVAQFRDQPLVGGALAFALGAAIGAALPTSETEDELLGEAADAAKAQLEEKTTELVDQGKEVAAELYDKTVAAASETHDVLKERIVSQADAFKDEVRKDGSRES